VQFVAGLVSNQKFDKFVQFVAGLVSNQKFDKFVQFVAGPWRTMRFCRNEAPPKFRRIARRKPVAAR
jgi:hypothetical protein